MTIIVAMTSTNGIGYKGVMPWPRNQTDMDIFRLFTLDKTVIMGRNTYESIGKPLRDRHNVVVTSDRTYGIQNTDIETIDGHSAMVEAYGRDNACVIGGGVVYAHAMPYASRLLVTVVPDAYACDAYFPTINQYQWREARRMRFGELTVVEYKKL